MCTKPGSLTLQRLTDAPSDRPVLDKLVPVSVMQIRKMWMLVR